MKFTLYLQSINPSGLKWSGKGEKIKFTENHKKFRQYLKTITYVFSCVFLIFDGEIKKSNIYATYQLVLSLLYTFMLKYIWQVR